MSNSITALRKARRQEQLVSKRLLRDDTTAEEGGQNGAGMVPDPLSEDEVKSMAFCVVMRVPGVSSSLQACGGAWVGVGLVTFSESLPHIVRNPVSVFVPWVSLPPG